MSDDLGITPVKKVVSSSEIEAWLVANISAILGVKPEEIDIKEPLDSYGLDSAQAMIIANSFLVLPHY
jgi:acyl carrier protein